MTTTEDLVISFLITWSIGLAAAAIVRFALVRRPLLHGGALVWATCLGLTEMALFISLGSKSKMHLALILVGIFAYRILRTQNGPWDTKIGATPSAPRAVVIRERVARLDTPKKRLFAVTFACWAISIPVLGIMSLVESNRAVFANEQGDTAYKEYAEIANRACPYSAETCEAGKRYSELFNMWLTAASDHKSLSESYLIIAIALFFGVPALFVLVRWILNGSVRVT